MSLSSALVLVHALTALVGLVAGALAMIFRKGSGLHGAAGTAFFVAMLAMSSTAAWVAATSHPNRLNVVVGLLTFYLVATAWWAARRGNETTGPFDRGALLFVALVAALGLAAGAEAAASPAGTKDDMPAPIYFVFGSIALLCAVTDLRLLRRGGVAGAARLRRHLWRMSLALLIATLSLFPGQARLFPDWVRQSSLTFTPHLLIAGSMLFWMFRLRARRRRRDAPPAERYASALAARSAGA